MSDTVSFGTVASDLENRGVIGSPCDVDDNAKGFVGSGGNLKTQQALKIVGYTGQGGPGVFWW